MKENGEPTPFYSQGAINTLITHAKNVDSITDSLKSGKGMNYDERGGYELAKCKKIIFFLIIFLFLLFLLSFLFFLFFFNFLIFYFFY